MRTVVVGTAGHVDHGKSALVRALTGTDPDRLEEERARGITIDLGFAHLPCGDVTLSFVDVPGHERFVRNMLAGATGMDLVVLVVSCDESVMSQTREHLHVCRLLGVRAGVVALSKADLADRDTVDLVRLEVGDLVRGTFLEGAPALACSATTGEGLAALRAALEVAARAAPPRPATGPLRVPIDRSFTLKGFGTVVTGTASSGTVRVGDEVEVLPAGRRARVRGVQAHGAAADEGRAGERVAMNLGGVDHSEIRRGDVVVLPGSHVAATRLDVAVDLLLSAPELPDSCRLRLHLGTGEVMARARWEGGATPRPGTRVLAQLALETPAVAAAGDRFILRRYSPLDTIGGGVVVHPVPAVRRRRSDGAGWAALAAAAADLAGGDLAGVLRRHVVAAGPGGAGEDEVAAWAGLAPAAVRGLFDGADGIERVADSPARWVARPFLDAAEARVLAALAAFHGREPLQPGMPKQALAGAARLEGVALAGLLARAERLGRLRVLRDVVAAAGHAVTLTPEEESARGVLLASHERAGLSPPEVATIVSDARLDPQRAQRIVRLLVGEGLLIRIREGACVHRRAMADLLAGMSSWYEPGQAFSVPDFKDRSGVSRKHGIPILEWLDSQGYTRRVGDGRVWTGKSAGGPAAEGTSP